MILRRRLLTILWLLFIVSFSFAFSEPPDITPESTRADAFSFAVFGDNRDGDEVFMKLIEQVNREREVAFCVSTGDFVSHGRKSEYEKYLQMIAKLRPKIYHTPGNHDLVKWGYKYYEQHFGPFYYSFDFGNSHFVVLNNAFQQSFHAEQFNWFKKDLAGTKKENIFVFMHKPTFDPTEIYKNYIMSGRQTIKELVQIFEKYGVDYVFTGHIHGYARAERNGVIYIVTAGAGAPLYLPADFGGFNHYVKIKVQGNKIEDEAVRLYEE